MNKTVLALTGIVSVGLSAAVFAAAPAWKPDRPVEFIVNTAPGSSPDKTARLLQNIMQQAKLVPVVVNVSNRPGGGGAVAYTYLNQFAGNGHYIFSASKTLLTTHIMGRSPITYTDVTPISHLFGEYIALAVKADSSIKDGRDLIERLKKDPGAASFGIATSLGNTNHQAAAAAMKDAGIDPRKARNVVFQSGGNAITALLGGHVDVVPVSIGSWATYQKAGQVRIIAVAAPKRLPGQFAQVPTWREQGRNVVVSNWRAVVGPKDMTPGQIAYWEGVIQKAMETEEWKKEIESINGTSEFMTSAETRKYMAEDYAEIKAFLTELELAK